MAHKIKPQEYYDTFIKEPTEGTCIICSKPTRYVDTNRGYKKYCSNLCSSKDKDLQKIKTQSYMDTLAKNPDINIRRNKTLSVMWQTNTALVEQRISNFKKTIHSNPHIFKEREQKRKIQEQLNPQINIDRGISVSIGLRNFYNDRSKTNSAITYHLYLVQHTERSIVKIGITSNLKKRLYEIKRIFGSSKCIHVVTDTYDIISKLEQHLHTHFNSECQIQPELGGGRTEWFNSTITNEAIKLMVLDHDTTNVR